VKQALELIYSKFIVLEPTLTITHKKLSCWCDSRSHYMQHYDRLKTHYCVISLFLFIVTAASWSVN